MTISRWMLLGMRNVLDNVLEKMTAHIFYSITICRKPCRLWDNVKKRGGAKGQTTQHGAYACHAWYVRLHARTRIYTYTCTCIHTQACARARAHTHTHRKMCNIYCFSTEKSDSRTRLMITLHVQCLSCSKCVLFWLLTRAPNVPHCNVLSLCQGGWGHVWDRIRSPSWRTDPDGIAGCWGRSCPRIVCRRNGCCGARGRFCSHRCQKNAGRPHQEADERLHGVVETTAT